MRKTNKRTWWESRKQFFRHKSKINHFLIFKRFSKRRSYIRIKQNCRNGKWINRNDLTYKIGNKGLYTKYKQGTQRALQIFQKIFCNPEDHRAKLNISLPSNFFEKNFMAPPINFSFSFKPWLSYISGWIIFTEIFKSLRSFNIHNNIHPETFTNNTWKQ